MNSEFAFKEAKYIHLVILAVREAMLTKCKIPTPYYAMVGIHFEEHISYIVWY